MRTPAAWSSRGMAAATSPSSTNPGDGVRIARGHRPGATPPWPTPATAMWWIMAPRRLLGRREGGRPPDLVDDPFDEGPVRFRRLPGRLPLRVRHERRPHPLAVGEVVVGADVDELVRFTDDGLPEADDPDPVLLEEVQRDLGEAPLEVGHTSELQSLQYLVFRHLLVHNTR